MGCFLCRPLDEVEQDPDISFYTTVGDVALFPRSSSYTVPHYLGRHDGIMYVKDETLYYENKCGGRLCCVCARQSFKLSTINCVKYRENDKVGAHGRGYSIDISLSPGLKIATTDDVLIAAAAPDAAVFSARLQQACNLKD